jgi:adenine C2-methylase RlmN of 23S rRNA A2503 and tRNA A37
LGSKLGHAAKERIKREFRQEQIWKALYQEYVRFLQIKELPSTGIPCLERDGTRQKSCVINTKPLATGVDLSKRDGTGQRIARLPIQAAKLL